MLDRMTRLLLRLYPEEFRARFGPQIEADLFHPSSNRLLALGDIVGSAIAYRLKSPGPYIWLAACASALAIVGAAAAVIPRWRPAFDSEIAVWVLLFSAVFLVLFGTLFLAVHWLQCSKSKI